MKDPKWTTSLYNHSPISDGILPLIGNAEFKQLFDRMPDRELWEIYRKLYSFEPKQIKQIEDILNDRIV